VASSMAFGVPDVAQSQCVRPVYVRTCRLVASHVASSFHTQHMRNKLHSCSTAVAGSVQRWPATCR
jgi:hypothetical protein